MRYFLSNSRKKSLFFEFSMQKTASIFVLQSLFIKELSLLVFAEFCKVCRLAKNSKSQVIARSVGQILLDSEILLGCLNRIVSQR